MSALRYGREGLIWTVALLAASAIAMPSIGVASAASPIAAWSFDETGGQDVLDSQGLAPGTLGRLPGVDGADPERVSGVAGRALLFDGDDRVVLPDLPQLEPPTLSISAWVRRIGSPGTYRYIVSKGGTRCFASAYGLYSGANGGLAFYVADGMDFVVSAAASPAQIWDGLWHSVAGTFDGARVRLYVDGAQLGGGTPAALTVSYDRDSRSPFIGTYVGSCELAWSGEIDEVAVWRGALGPPDVVALAIPPQRGQPTPPGPPPPGPPPPPPPPPAPGPFTGEQPAPHLPTRCVTITVSHRHAVIRHRVRVVVRVRLRGRPVRRAVVRLAGAGVMRVARTARDGRVRLSIRPTRRAVVSVKVAGRTACDAARISVHAR
jgi:concanavalin A-like lectin/glucanase superfamily protein